MATQTISRSFLRRPEKSLSVLFTRSFSSSPTASRSASTLLNRSRPLVAGFCTVVRAGLILARDLSTQASSVSPNDSNRNWSNRPPKESILLDGCDFEHWLVVMEKPEGDLTRDEIIDYYIKTLAQVLGSEDEARMKIYSVSHRCYYAFGALVPEDLSHKIKELPKVRWVLPDSYLDVQNKDYGGEPFIDGKAVPYDPKYHEEWTRNNAKATDGNRRTDRNRSRNFRGNQGTGYNRGPPPNQGMGGPPPPHMGNNPNMPPHMPPPNMNQNYRGPPPPPPNMSQNYQRPPPPNMNGGWSGNYQQNGGYQQGLGGGMQQQQPYTPNRDQYHG